jgi:glucose dehydrogenase
MQVKQVRFLAQAALLALFPAAASAQNMFKGCPTHCGEYQGAPRTLDTPAWTFMANGPILSSAAVANGVAYFGSDDKNMYALCIKSGEVIWKFATGGMVRSSPAVSGGIVYFASYDGNIYAVCAKSGELVWKFATAGERHFEARGLHGYKPSTQTIPDFWDMFESSPLVGGGLVYCGSGDGNMYALDAATGEKRWAFQTGDVVHSSPALADGTLYFGSFDTYMYAVDALTGVEKWRFKTGDDPQAHNRTGIQASPTVSGGTVFFGCRDFNFYALTPRHRCREVAPQHHVGKRHGLRQWRRRLYGTSIPAFVVGLDVATGEVRMKLPMPPWCSARPSFRTASCMRVASTAGFRS